MKNRAKQKFWLEPSSDCRNCGAEMPEGANYCPTCSQRNTTGKIKLWDFLKEAFSNFFNIDTKFFRTLGSFAFPGKLTNEFFKGRHQSFASPLRMFFVTIVLFLAALGWSFQDSDMESDFMGIEKSKTRDLILDSVTVYHQALLEEAKDDKERRGIDTLYKKIMKELEIDTTGTVALNFFKDSTSIKKIDVYQLTADEIIEKYEIEGFFNQLSIKQMMKVNNDPKSLINSLLGNITFMFLLLIPCMAFVFKLLYIRQGRYYVEHLVFLFHFHAFGLLIGLVIIFLLKYEMDFGITLLGVLTSLYLILSMKRIYTQSWIKTILKFSLVIVSYLFVFMLCLSFITITSFLFF